MVAAGNGPRAAATCPFLGPWAPRRKTHSVWPEQESACRDGRPGPGGVRRLWLPVPDVRGEPGRSSLGPAGATTSHVTHLGLSPSSSLDSAHAYYVLPFNLHPTTSLRRFGPTAQVRKLDPRR